MDARKSSGIVSSDDTTPFEMKLDNNTKLYNILVKPYDVFTSGFLEFEVLNKANGIYEHVYVRDGRTAKIYLAEPRAITIHFNSLHDLRITPMNLDTGKSYEVFVENLLDWGDA